MILWLHYFRPRSAWYELGATQQAGFEAAWRAVATAAAGAEFLGEYSVRGQSTQERVQVWRFVDADCLEALWSSLLEQGYADWRVTENVVGVPEITFDGATG